VGVGPNSVAYARHVTGENPPNGLRPLDVERSRDAATNATIRVVDELVISETYQRVALHRAETAPGRFPNSR